VCNAASGIPSDGITTDAFISLLLRRENKTARRLMQSTRGVP
jgi:hypothetical protein